LQKKSEMQNLPFGVFMLPDGSVATQDFAYNRLFLKGIKERLVLHPYRLADQEKLVRHMVPEGKTGMTHAYSPVAFVMMQPLLDVSGGAAYLVYTTLCAGGISLLFYFYLLPLTKCPSQIYALLVCAFSVCVIAAFTVGQSALVTTTFIGFFWSRLKRREVSRSIVGDVLIAVLFWAVCLKPSLAIIPGALLLGAKAWRPVAFGALLLLTTWTCFAGYYGGWWTGFWDYLYLLNHYNNADFTPFMQRGYETDDQKRVTLLLFSLDRVLVLVSCLTLVILRWRRRITGSEQFQATVWAFLLLSPYLLPSENWILCLLVVEGSFFQSKNLALIAGKLLLLGAILDLRSGVTFSWPVDAHLKWLFFAWIVTEWLLGLRAVKREVTRVEFAPRGFSTGLFLGRGCLRVAQNLQKCFTPPIIRSAPKKNSR
jgi:hypothetical protein